MFLFKGDKLAMFDVDDTLLKWCPSEDDKEDNGIDHNFVIRSMATDNEGRMVLKEKVEEDAFIPIKVHINQLKEHKRHGHAVIVWSAGGAEWAYKACKMLGIEDYVDMCMDKPTSVYDDKQVTDFMPKSQYLVKPDDPKDDDEPISKKEAISPFQSEDSGIGETTAPTRRPTNRTTAAAQGQNTYQPYNRR